MITSASMSEDSVSLSKFPYKETQWSPTFIVKLQYCPDPASQQGHGLCTHSSATSTLHTSVSFSSSQKPNQSTRGAQNSNLSSMSASLNPEQARGMGQVGEKKETASVMQRKVSTLKTLWRECVTQCCRNFYQHLVQFHWEEKGLCLFSKVFYFFSQKFPELMWIQVYVRYGSVKGRGASWHHLKWVGNKSALVLGEKPVGSLLKYF